MTQLQILSGRKAGQTFAVSELPFQIGRLSSAQLSLEDPGVWEKHLQIELDPEDGFFVRNSSPAITSVNGTAIERQRLKNGDTIEVGGAKLRFWISAPKQRDLRLREFATWLGIAALCLLQIGIIYLIAI